MTADLRFDHYDWAGGREAMLRLGPQGGPTVVVALPLFEEANRTRALVVATLRLLAARGIGGALPDLPGQGDSLVATGDARLPAWRSAFAAAVATLPGPIHIVAIRGGSLVDSEAKAVGRWHLSPLNGEQQVRELNRLRTMAGDGESFGGNDLSPLFLAELERTEPTTKVPLRIVRLAGDARPANTLLAFAPPWRTAEPQRDDALAAALADDIAGWIASCAA